MNRQNVFISKNALRLKEVREASRVRGRTDADATRFLTPVEVYF